MSRRAVGETRFPTALAYDEDTLFWARLMCRGPLAVITQPVMTYFVSAERSDDRFTIKPAQRFLAWRHALRQLTDCGIAKRRIARRDLYDHLDPGHLLQDVGYDYLADEAGAVF